MKKLSITLVFTFFTALIYAQQPVHIQGQIENFDQAERVYLALGEQLFPLNIPEAGVFSLDGNVGEMPAYLIFSKISKGEKLKV